MNQQVLDFSHDCSLWKPPSHPGLSKVGKYQVYNCFNGYRFTVFEVMTFKGNISTFFHLELLLLKVLVNKCSLFNVSKFNEFLNFSDM